MNSDTRASFLKHFAYLIIFLSLVSLSNPTYSSTNSRKQYNAVPSAEIKPTIAKKAATKEKAANQANQKAIAAKKAAEKATAKAKAAKKAAEKATAKAKAAKKKLAQANSARKASLKKAASRAASLAAAARKAATKASNQASAARKAADKASNQAIAAKKAADKATAQKKAQRNANNKPKKSNKNTIASSNKSRPPSAIKLHPLRDLGIEKGFVCFRVKAYSNIEVSNFSKAVCTYIKNSKAVKLAWAPESSNSDAIIGYRVYFGNSAKKTNTLVTDVK